MKLSWICPKIKFELHETFWQFQPSVTKGKHHIIAHKTKKKSAFYSPNEHCFDARVWKILLQMELSSNVWRINDFLPKHNKKTSWKSLSESLTSSRSRQCIRHGILVLEWQLSAWRADEKEKLKKGSSSYQINNSIGVDESWSILQSLATLPPGTQLPKAAKWLFLYLFSRVYQHLSLET